MIAMLYDQKPPIFSKNGVYGICYHQIFSWGYQTKMKIWSEIFSHTSGVQKKVFPNFSPAAGFFRRGATENR